jgi:hypothetical protein
LAALLALPQAHADTYDAASNRLSIPAVLVGSTFYTDVQVTVAKVLYVGSGAPVSAYDTYIEASNQLSVPSVTVGGTAYTNVLVNVGEVLSVGGSQPAYANTLVSKFCPTAMGYGTYANCKATGDSATPDLMQPLTHFFNGATGTLTGGTRTDVSQGAACTLAVEPFIPLFASTVNGKQDAGAAFKGLADDAISVDTAGNIVQITVGQRGVGGALEINAIDGHVEAVLFDAKGDYAICTFR